MPLFLPDLTYSSCLPSRRIARLQVFQLFLSPCLPPGISLEFVVVYVYNSFILACMLGLGFRGCVGNLVIPYYSIDYLYSILNLPCIMIGYIKCTVVLISQLKGAVHPLVLTDQGISKPPPVLSFITLITYLLSITLALSCLGWP